MTFQSYQDIMLWKPPTIKNIIDGGILYEGTKLIVYGLPKRHKSVVAEQLAFCVAVGTPWLGFKTERIKVGYVQGEVPRPMFRERTLKMGRNQQVPSDSLYFMTHSNLKLDRDSGIKEIEKAIKRNKPQLLIIDPIYKFTTGSDEVNLLHFVDNMDYLIGQYGITIVLVHHSRKPGTSVTGDIIDQGGTELRGPVLEAWADSLIRIQGALESDDRELTFELRHAAQFIPQTSIRLDRKRLWFVRV